jgi:23S rRNA (guanosine2251-2'-O)-methyltransferase
MDEKIAGRRPVMEALNSDMTLNKIIISKGEKHGLINRIIKVAKQRKIPLQFVEKRVLDALTDTNHQGVIAYVTSFKYCDVEDILLKAREKAEPPFLILLDEVKDPHNLGAIIRSAEAMGVHGLIIPKRQAAQVNSTVIKTSSGASHHLLISRVSNLVYTIRYLKGKGVWIAGADMQGKTCYNQDLKGPIGLVIGSEGEGLGRLTRENCDFLISIPMTGKIQSLNASVAAAILMYEIKRQREA